MDWNQALRSTIRQWEAIRDSIGSASDVELLTEINAVSDLCEKAREESIAETGAPFDRCQYCIAFQQFGGCQEISARMSEAVVEKNWPRLRQLVDETLRALKTTTVQPAGTAGATAA
jgi:hypothetical protein